MGYVWTPGRIVEQEDCSKYGDGGMDVYWQSGEWQWHGPEPEGGRMPHPPYVPGVDPPGCDAVSADLRYGSREYAMAERAAGYEYERRNSEAWRRMQQAVTCGQRSSASDYDDAEEIRKHKQRMAEDEIERKRLWAELDAKDEFFQHLERTIREEVEHDSALTWTPDDDRWLEGQFYSAVWPPDILPWRMVDALKDNYNEESDADRERQIFDDWTRSSAPGQITQAALVRIREQLTGRATLGARQKRLYSIMESAVADKMFQRKAYLKRVEERREKKRNAKAARSGGCTQCPMQSVIQALADVLSGQAQQKKTT